MESGSPEETQAESEDDVQEENGIFLVLWYPSMQNKLHAKGNILVFTVFFLFYIKWAVICYVSTLGELFLYSMIAC